MRLSKELAAAIDAPFPPVSDEAPHTLKSLRYLFRGLANDVADVLPDGCTEQELKAITALVVAAYGTAVSAAERSAQRKD